MRDSESVPVHLVSTCGSRVIRLDLSENCLRLKFCLLLVFSLSAVLVIQILSEILFFAGTSSQSCLTGSLTIKKGISPELLSWLR